MYLCVCGALLGSILLDEEARAEMIDRIFPHATLITPNKHEAEVGDDDTDMCVCVAEDDPVVVEMK